MESGLEFYPFRVISPGMNAPPYLDIIIPSGLGPQELRRDITERFIPWRRAYSEIFIGYFTLNRFAVELAVILVREVVPVASTAAILEGNALACGGVVTVSRRHVVTRARVQGQVAERFCEMPSNLPLVLMTKLSDRPGLILSLTFKAQILILNHTLLLVVWLICC